MRDTFNREINYLRISITDRCNLRCFYCMPEAGFPLVPHAEILSFERIVAIVTVAVELGITKIRLTGGEPLVRHGVIELVAMLAQIKGIKDFAMTTNGILLAKYAKALAQAGLHRVNISLDTLDAKRYAAITRGGNLADVLNGIEAAIIANLQPVKLNCVATTPEDVAAVKKYAMEKGLAIRVIKPINLRAGKFAKIKGATGGDCAICNRLRLLSDGRLLPCLFADTTFSTKKLGIREAFRQAILCKPAKGVPSNKEWMGNIGG
jgi:GTP 3',8-cyclase